MDNFCIGDRVYAGYDGDCSFFGEIDSIDPQNKTCTLEFETDKGCGRLIFALSDLCRRCECPKADCKVNYQPRPVRTED